MSAKFLQEVRGVIDKGWTQNALARDSHGKAVSATSRKAERYCLLGAITKVEVGGWRRRMFGLPRWDEEKAARRLLMDALRDTSGTYGIDYIVYNDRPSTTKYDVLKLLDAAIDKAKAEAD